tara:strand:- start:1053 stop:2966 length:1914 start_codon:yes stop_codon:yes gene_type:complete
MADNYLSGSQFGNVAGALLARKRKVDKDQARKAIFASAIFETIGALQRKQQTNLNTDIENINTQFQDIFVNNREEWDGSKVNRQAIEEADRIGEEAYLNKRVNENIDYLLEGFGVSWDQKNNQSEEVQNKMMAIYNKQRKREKEILDLLKQNPVNTYNSFSQYNKAAKNEYLAALNAVKDDPTRKGLLAAAFNRIFRTEKDAEGNLTSTNAQKIELENSLETANRERQEFRKGVTSAEALLKNRYSSMVGKTSQELENNLVPLAKKPFTFTQVSNQITRNNEIFDDGDFNKKAYNVTVLNTGLTLENINDIPKRSKDNTEEVNIIKAWEEDRIKYFDPDTKEISSISSYRVQEFLAVTALALNDARMKNKINPTTGPNLIYESLELLAKEDRFLKIKEFKKDVLNYDLPFIGEGNVPFTGEVVFGADDILLIGPSQTGKNLLRNKVSASDAVTINQSQGSENIVTKEDIKGPPEYDGLTVLDFLQSEKFRTNSKNNQIESINELKESYPDRAEEIDTLYNLVLKSQPAKEKTKKLDNDIKEAKTTSNKNNNKLEVDVEAKRDEMINTLGKDISSFFKSQQGKADLNKLERYSDNDYRNTVVIKKLLKKYGLSENASPAEVANFLDNFNSESSLLARQ